jgi:predicted Rossmann fold flavoprotein
MKRVGIIGGGAAGVFCAIQMGSHSNLDVDIIEKSGELLRKVKISGGGRCNVTHHFVSNAQFIKSYPRGSSILKKNFDQFGPLDMQVWLESRGVVLKTEADGRMFPSTDDSQTIIDLFLSELQKQKIVIKFHTEVLNLKRSQDKWEMSTNNGSFQYDYLVIASGGAQKPRDLDFLSSIGIRTISPVPSLFTFKILDKNLTSLMGLSVNKATVKIAGTKLSETGPVLITHWGLSGPAVLKLSAWGAFVLHEKNYEFDIQVNWLGDKNDLETLTSLIQIQTKHPKATISNQKISEIPTRLWTYLLSKSEILETKKWSELSKKDLNRFTHNLVQSNFSIRGKTTYKEEFVTAGGVETEQLNASKMEHNHHPNIYFIGEITNIDGITGGFNFQNAWTSAVVCARDIMQKAKF